jgi:purine nucleosidase
VAAVFFDHDGGIDDFLSLLLLLTYDRELLGISVTPADCIGEAAVSATARILRATGFDVPLALGTLDGPNPFPLDWRLDSVKIDFLPVLNQRDGISTVADTGQTLLARTIAHAEDPITLLMTGPLTNLAWALDHDPAVEAKIAELVWMGGALEVPGNVSQPGHDGSAEWNVYWDPPAAKRVWDSGIPLTIFPLDVTNSVPVTDEFLRSIGRQYRHLYSEIAGTIWAFTAAHVERTGEHYYFWDTLTTTYLARPDLCEYDEVRCDVIPGGESQGRTVITDNGRPVKVATAVDTPRFLEHLLETLAR